MKKSLITKALELRDAGFTAADIAEELNISVDTALYLVLNGEKLLNEPENSNVESIRRDIFVEWDGIKTSSKRLKYLAMIMCDLLKNNDFDAVVGISTGGVPLATLISDILDKEFYIYTPKKHLQSKTDKSTGVIGQSKIPKNKKIVIVDDVMTSGNTMKEAVGYLKTIGEPIKAMVIIDKKGIDCIEGTEIISLFKVGIVEINK